MINYKNIVITTLLVSILNRLIGIFPAILITIIFSVYREYYNEIIYKNWNFKNLISDLLGILLGLL